MTAPAAPADTAPPAPAPEATPQQEMFSADYVKTLRDEAAAARIAKKEAVEAAKAEVIKEYEGKAAEADTKLAELQTSAAADALELMKLKAVLEAKVPTDDILEVAALVQGTDEATVSESVNRVKALLGKAPAKVPAVDSTQGTGGSVPLNGDPVLNILKRAVRAQ